MDLASRRLWREARLEARLVWIFGSPRTGSTWLMNLLSHPLITDNGIASGVGRLDAPEADRPRTIPINEPYVQDHLAPAFSLPVLEEGDVPVSTLPEFRHAEPNYLLADRYVEAWRPALRTLVLARLEAQARVVAREHRVPAGPIVIKEPNGSLAAGFVMSLFPRSRMIFLLRDGRDVVDSMVDAQMPGGWLASPLAERAEQHRRERLTLVKRESRMWLARTQAVRRAYEAHPPELRRLVRYEELLSDTPRVLAELEQWLDVRRTAAGHADALRWNDFAAAPAESKGRGKPMRAAQPGLWRENLDAREQAAMHEMMGDELAALGYKVQPAAVGTP
ncbi:MAG TPA: sulfotransferase [Solirubrobacteraceae bacterium]|nr:sulfotransferase [Solirubrobacteraceae bacterium]